VTLPGWTREPLVHFLGLGALVYLTLTWGGSPVDPASRMISVDSDQKAQLALGFERVMGRAPTDAELDARIERYVREEVLYREALRLGLDQGDAVVRQRLVAKMDMSASVAAEVAGPDEAELRAFFEDNASRYTDALSVSFEQAYFTTEAAARDALPLANDGKETGEPISLPRRVEDERLAEVQTRFGEQFARGLAALDEGVQWQGPVPSGFGWHLVRLQSREPVAADFEAVRDRVENDWRNAQIEQRKQRAYQILRSAYRVDIAK
jgi:hypothetical protein